MEIDDIEVTEEIVNFVYKSGYEIYSIGCVEKGEYFVSFDPHTSSYMIALWEGEERSPLLVIKVRQVGESKIPRYYIDTCNLQNSFMDAYVIKDRNASVNFCYSNVYFLNIDLANKLVVQLNNKENS